MSNRHPRLQEPEPKKRAGRPAVRQGRLGAWLQTHFPNRAQAAELLAIDRRYLDHLAREDRRPSLELAVKIQRLTGGAISVAYLSTLAPAARRRHG